MGKVAPFSLLTPLTSLVMARLILGEELSLHQYLGSMVVLLGLCIVNFNGRFKKDDLGQPDQGKPPST